MSNQSVVIKESISKSRYFSVLTGIRAIAAYMVFVSHYNPFAINSSQTPLHNWLSRFFGTFSIGVSIFFVLSGFLITFRYEEYISLSWQWVRRYVRNRIARIYPMYFLVTLATLIGTALNTRYDASTVWNQYNLKDKILVSFLNFTFLRGFFDRYRYTMVGQGWSLTVEECFYLSAPFLLLGLRGKWRRILAYPIMIFALGLLLTAIGSTFHEQLYGFFGSVEFMLNWTFFGRCLEFVLGMGMALYLRRNPTFEVKGWRFTTLGIVWIICSMIAMVYLGRSTSAAAAAAGTSGYDAFFIKNAVLPIGIVLFFWGLIQEKTWLNRILATKTFDLLGKSSYTFYLIHVGILNFLLDDFITNNVTVKFVIINIVSIGLYKFVEHPLHLFLTKGNRR